MLKIDGKHSSKAAQRATADVAQGLRREVFLIQDAKVMLARNLWSEVGLVHGIREDVVDILWTPGEKALPPPEFAVVRFNEYTGPAWSGDPRYPECVPIAVVEASWSATGDDNKQESRNQLPLALCWAITMHKSQGQTVDKAVIDLGKSKAPAGLTFVCLSCAKRLLDLLVEPMLFDRLSNLGEKTTLKLRLEEEMRLKTVAAETLIRHGVQVA